MALGLGRLTTPLADGDKGHSGIQKL
jgi:hypothetical protein